MAAIRAIAAEQGVSQQAIYFAEEARGHAAEAEMWLGRTVWLTVGLGAYSVLTLFMHKVPWLAASNAFDATQLGIGKVLVFVTIASFLLLSARSYSAHRHNAIVNKRRQNSLVTYRALVEAAGDQANRDIVLTKAAESIFNSEPTGFAKADGADTGAFAMINAAPSLLKGPHG